jgi:hypothetical protein
VSDPGGATSRRPTQVTVAGVVAAGACALLVVTLFNAQSRLRSAEVHDSLAEALARQGRGVGLSVEDVLGVLRGVVFLSAALAAAGVVLAVFALKRHRAARVGLTVVAVLLLVTATFVVGLLPILVLAAAGRLWARDAREWFDGRAPTSAGSARAGPAPPPTGSPTGPPTGSPTGPPTGSPTGSSTGPPASPYAFGSAPGPGGRPGPVRRTPVRGGRPASVAAAVWLTWVFASVAALFFLALGLALVVDQAQLVEALQRDARVASARLSDQTVLGVVWVMAAFGAAWSLAAVALAMLAYRRVEAGRIGLVVCAVPAGVLAAVAFPVGLPMAVAAFATVVLLFVGGSGPWYSGRRSQEGLPGPPPGGPPGHFSGHPPVQQPGQPPGQSGDEPPDKPQDRPPVW